MAYFDDPRDRLIGEVKIVLSDTEELLKAVANESKEKIASARPKLEAAVERAKTAVAEMELVLESRARQARRDIDSYAHENPWKTSGMAAAIGAAVGTVIGVLLARR